MQLLQPAKAKKELSIQGAISQYIRFNVILEACASIQKLAPANKPTTPEEFKLMNKTLKCLRETKFKGLTYFTINQL